MEKALIIEYDKDIAGLLAIHMGDLDFSVDISGDGKESDYINISIRSSDTQKIEISIVDSGAGMNPRELPYIFDRYYKGKEYSESTGLGLAIVKKIIELHHSDIVVKSQPGKGTSFSFTLPAITAA